MPEFNTILHKKWISEAKRMHKRKIIGTQKCIDNSLPTACKYPIVKSKKELLIEGKFFCSSVIFDLQSDAPKSKGQTESSCRK